ncbi:ABC transporter substrate-binding protein [Streptosporangiaceae bacterium NEAU-GS5]|nr:ABC transporter substrate-binding protein [Streptosporangiaceae bacterium NEAU-GS5]
MRRLTTGRSLALGIAVVFALASCGSSGSSSTTAGSSNGLEKTTLTVGVLPIADVAALFIANQRGFFKAEGLTVKPEIVANGAAAIPRLINGTLDFALGNYFGVLSAQDKGAANMKIVADTYQAKPDIFDIVVPKDSTIQSVADLKGKRVAVAGLNTIATLAVDATLRVNGLASTDVHYVEVPFPEMPGKLFAGAVDAAFLTEPFLTGVQKNGARKIADTMTGAMADFPIACWVTVDDFAKKNPKTVAAFQRAIVKAEAIADSDRKAVEAVLPTYTKIDAATASIITLGSFPTTLNPTRIQRVADLMLEYNYLKSKMDVQPLLVPLPAAQ